MQKRKKSRGSRLFLLFLLFGCTMVGYCGYRWGKDFWTLFRRNAALKFYNVVLETYIPEVVVTESDHRPSLYEDAAAILFPSFSYHEQQLWCDSQAERQMDYEELAAAENEQIGRMIAENGQNGTETGDSQTAGGGSAGSGSAGTGSAENGSAGNGSAGNGSSGSETAGSEAAGSDAGETQGGASGTGIVRAEQKQVEINREKLKDFDYLRQNFYQVDSSTTIGSDQLNVEKLLGVDVTLSEQADGPQILIYHTHSQEGYADSVPGDPNSSVMAVGDYLTQLLTEQYGFRVLHHTGTYDVGDRDHAYYNAAPALEQILAENPSIEMVIDLHRDGVAETTHLVTEQNGKQMAKIMFFNGLCRSATLGDLTNQKNPYLDQNLALSFQMQLAAREYYPDFTRNIYLKAYRYNMHYCPKSMLIEVGAQTNTLEEAKNAMEPLADLLDKVLHGRG